MALDVLQWTNKSREDVNFVLEGKLQFTQATEANWRRWNVKMTPVSALLVTLGRNSLEPPSSLQDDGTLNFPVETGVVEAALLLIREKNNRFSMIKVKKNQSPIRKKWPLLKLYCIPEKNIYNQISIVNILYYISRSAIFLKKFHPFFSGKTLSLEFYVTICVIINTISFISTILQNYAH